MTPCTADPGCKPIDSPHTRWSPAEHCTDPSHPHFWHPENWPRGRAPARVEYHEGWSGYSVSVWVNDAAGIADLWWGSVIGAKLGHAGRIHRDGETHDEARVRLIRRLIREAEQAARKLEGEVDEYLLEREELEELQLTVRSVPA